MPLKAEVKISDGIGASCWLVIPKLPESAICVGRGHQTREKFMDSDFRRKP